MTRQLTPAQKAAKNARAAARRYRRAAGLEIPAALDKEIKQAKKADAAALNARLRNLAAATVEGEDMIANVAARLTRDTLGQVPLAHVEGHPIFLGDYVGFKDDIEQYGKVTGRSGNFLTIEARDQRTDEPYTTTQAIDRCWIE